jgi:hypothetical protein
MKADGLMNDFLAVIYLVFFAAIAGGASDDSKLA